jgi:mono/diheme cytochrome c family protein
MSVYVEETLASICGDPTRYDRFVSTVDSRLVRLVIVPLLLFAAFSGGAFALAELHFAKPGLPKTGGKVTLGDPYRGETVFSQKCASCHGVGGAGGGIGPKLTGLPLSLAAAKAQIDNGDSVMPASLVTGGPERDVLAYLATVLAPP